ncbi:unnamed protein product, partial [Rotaria magnacalcarata]
MIDDSESNIDIESEYDPIEESTFSCTTHTDTVASTTSVSSGSTTNTTINNNSFSRPYSPVCRKGIVHEHDKPYLEFGHLNCRCEYQVTDSATAWNEYMKKGLNFIEYGLFHDSKDSEATKQWSGITGK